MGQYFIFVNLDKKEFLESFAAKFSEIILNNAGALLVYLLATNNPNGTPLRRIIPKDHAGSYLKNGWFIVEDKNAEEHALLRFARTLSNDDSEQDMCVVEYKAKYFGRWCGDRIVVLGDYGDRATNYGGPTYFDVLENFKDITNEVLEEFNKILGALLHPPNENTNPQ